MDDQMSKFIKTLHWKIEQGCHQIAMFIASIKEISSESQVEEPKLMFSLKSKPLEVKVSLIEFKNWMKAFGRFYSAISISKLLLDDQQGYLDNCLSPSCRGNLEEFLDKSDIQSIDAGLDGFNRHYQKKIVRPESES
ncbi:unnamed protein product [Lepeophtheirus salmonis]|uniref:(salmon louse) hypothetical protein n=1 Tax=Lepeophtheirus salmonis TaxID=72036 RepID=A0A7R8CJ91_LEPSM|nr:unnamed protein product [Lepeophtheirus salmonis]CAF2808751.1 unnamed protein product [Lepeophtheirus salmonis]